MLLSSVVVLSKQGGLQGNEELVHGGVSGSLA